MADRVQFVMDRMAVTFREMEQYGVFSAEEVRSVVKKRTDFEYRLRRRQQTPGDYYGYLEYELSLEELRDVRCRRQGSGQDPDQPDLSKELMVKHRKLRAAFMKHISYVFERGLRRFPDNMGMWNDYISFLQDKKATSTLNTVFGRALCLHPKNESLWLQAAVFEINSNSNAHAARVLLQRALRVNKHSQKLWETYFHLELWHVARCQERRRLLGLKAGAPAEEEDDQALGAPWVVYRHATKNISGLGFAVAFLQSTGPGCAAGSCDSSALQVEMQRDIQARFSDTLEYWSAMVQLSVQERVSRLESTLKQRKLSAKKTQRLLKKRSLQEATGAAEAAAKSVVAMQRGESCEEVTLRLHVAAEALQDCLVLLQSCSETVRPGPAFLGICMCDALHAVSSALSLPAHMDARLSELDLFRSIRDMDVAGLNVLETLAARLQEATRFLEGVGPAPELHAAQLIIATLRAILISQYPAVSHESANDDILRRESSSTLKWLLDNSADDANINVWAVLAFKTFRAHSIAEMVAGGGGGDLHQLAAVVLSRAAVLVNPPQVDAAGPHASTSQSSSFAADVVSYELKTDLLAQAIDSTLLHSPIDIHPAKLAIESALLGRMPITVHVSSEPAAVDSVYVDWLLRYVQLALLHEGVAGWRQACEFVEQQCFSARPHCVASLVLDRYYEHVVAQGMALLRDATRAGSPEGVAGFVRRLVRAAGSRCASNDYFAAAEEEAARLAGQHEQANHACWKRGRDF